MTDQQENPREENFVSRLVPNPSRPPDTILLTGYLGDSSEEGCTRLYFDPQLNNYVEISNEDILHTQEIPRDQSPFGGSYVWIRKEAELTHGKVGTERTRARFLEGPIVQDYLQAAQYGGGAAPAATQAGCPPVTQVGCPQTLPPQCPQQTMGPTIPAVCCGIPTLHYPCHTQQYRCTAYPIFCSTTPLCTVSPPCHTQQYPCTFPPICPQQTLPPQCTLPPIGQPITVTPPCLQVAGGYQAMQAPVNMQAQMGMQPGMIQMTQPQWCHLIPTVMCPSNFVPWCPQTLNTCNPAGCPTQACQQGPGVPGGYQAMQAPMNMQAQMGAQPGAVQPEAALQVTQYYLCRTPLCPTQVIAFCMHTPFCHTTIPVICTPHCPIASPFCPTPPTPTPGPFTPGGGFPGGPVM